MRTTVTLDEDVAAAVDRFRRDRHLGLSAAVNELVRRGLVEKPARRRFRQRTHDMGMKIDVANVAEAIEAAEGSEWH